MANFEGLFMTFMLAALMVFGILTFGIGLQEENNAPSKIIDIPLINQSFTNLRSNLSSFSEQGQTQKSLFESENPTAGFGSIILFSIASSGKIFNGMVIGIFNIFIRLPAVVLGLDPVTISVLGVMLIVTIILGLWAVYKLGG